MHIQYIFCLLLKLNPNSNSKETILALVLLPVINVSRMWKEGMKCDRWSLNLFGPCYVLFKTMKMVNHPVGFQ